MLVAKKTKMCIFVHACGHEVPGDFADTEEALYTYCIQKYGHFSLISYKYRGCFTHCTGDLYAQMELCEAPG